MDHYASLRAEVIDAGLLERGFSNYTRLVIITLALGVSAFLVFLWAPGISYLLSAILFTEFWMQVGFFGHDAGHDQVFKSTKKNLLFGFACYSLTLGMSFRPWKSRHTNHHVKTNLEGEDPDLANRLVAFTEEDAIKRRTGSPILRWMAINQGWLYPFLGCLATFGFRTDGVRYILGLDDQLYGKPSFFKEHAKERRLETYLLGIWVLTWIITPCILFGAGHWLPVFILGQLMFGFHMSMVFAPNHKGMPTYTRKTKPPFFEWQVRTSRNVRPGSLTDFLYGGLNYQIEHHLFPTMCRRHLGLARMIVRAKCKELQEPYAEESLFQSVRTVLSTLDEVGQLARPLSTAS